MKRLLATALLVVALPATAADAATVHVAQSHPKRFRDYSGYDRHELAAYYDASPGEVNHLVVTESRDPANDLALFTFHDPGATVTTSDAHCKSIDVHTASCEADGLYGHAEVTLGDGDDTLAVTGNAFVTALGGAGDDVLRAGNFGSELYGGGGSDKLLGGAANDVLIDQDRSGAAGAAGPGPDLMDGGAGYRNLVSYEGRTRGVRVDLRRETGQGEPGENDTIRNVDAVFGGHARDRLVTPDSGGTLRGDAGDDVLIGGPGQDWLYGSEGRDRLYAGGSRDRLYPGPGIDSFLCGHGIDKVYEPSPEELMTTHCNIADLRGVFGANADESFVFRAQPAALSRRYATFVLPCPQYSWDLSEGGGPRGCKATITARTRAGRVLARGHYESDGTNTRVRLPLTKLGRRLTARRHGVVATLTFDTPYWRIRNVFPAWTVRLKR